MAEAGDKFHTESGQPLVAGGLIYSAWQTQHFRHIVTDTYSIGSVHMATIPLCFLLSFFCTKWGGELSLLWR